VTTFTNVLFTIGQKREADYNFQKFSQTGALLQWSSLGALERSYYTYRKEPVFWNLFFSARLEHCYNGAVLGTKTYVLRKKEQNFEYFL